MDEDDDISQIRARRLAQLQAQGGGGGGPSRGGLPSGMGEGPGGGGPGGEKKSQEQIEAERRAEEEQLRVIMSSVLEPAARERLSRINLTRPQLSRQVQSILLRMAQQGQLRGKVSDDQLVGLLEQAQGMADKAVGGATGKITFARKARDDSDDDDFDL